MRARDVIGKRIVGVDQFRGNPGGTRSNVTCVRCLILEDGTRLYPITQETEYGEYWHDIAVNKVPKVRKGKKVLSGTTPGNF